MTGRPLLSAMTGGNTVGAEVRGPHARADGYRHIDTHLLMCRLTAAHATTYTFGIWESATDWDDLRTEFAPAAQRAGIEVMVYLVPPSECFPDPQKHLAGRSSRPFELDYPEWARQIAQLSVQYPTVTGWAIDDFLVSGPNAELFTRDYLAELRAVTDAVNPALKFFVTLYGWQLGDAELALVSESLDGVIYPYLGHNNNTIDDTLLEQRLDTHGRATDAHGLELILLVYAGRFLEAPIPPTGRYVADVLGRAAPYLDDGRIDGIIAYGMPVQIDTRQPSSLCLAHSGTARLSLSVTDLQPTPAGSNATAAQRISIEPSAPVVELNFLVRIRDGGGPADQHLVQLLLDGVVVWELDAAVVEQDRWLRTSVDLKAAAADRRQAEIAFRLIDPVGTVNRPIDVSIDELSAVGLQLADTDFAHPAAWTLTRVTRPCSRTSTSSIRTNRCES